MTACGLQKHCTIDGSSRFSIVQHWITFLSELHAISVCVRGRLMKQRGRREALSVCRLKSDTPSSIYFTPHYAGRPRDARRGTQQSTHSTCSIIMGTATDFDLVTLTEIKQRNSTDSTQLAANNAEVLW